MIGYRKATDRKEIAYIRKRKQKAFWEGLCFCLCRMLPINKNLISVCTFEGKGGFGCNPKYVVGKLHEQSKKYRFVWFVNKEAWGKEFPDYIKKIPNNIWSRAYWLSRSKIWIDNYRKPYGTKKRKGQYYLNTNHYTLGIKCTGLFRGDGFSEMAYLVSKNDSDMIDDLVIDSKWCEDCFDKALVYSGHMLKSGSPRCDVLYGNREGIKESFRESHNLPDDAKILMYAPTFREGAKDGKRFVFSKEWTLDFERLINELENKFGGTWFICVRVHPQLAASFEEYRNDKIQSRIINESNADDMYEILAAMDAYITDYSSACFEAGLAGIPTFIYADDIKTYSDSRGALYWNLGKDSNNHVGINTEFCPGYDVTFPFDISEDNDELSEIIGEFDSDVYEDRLNHFYEKMGVVFDGKATEKVASVIAGKINSAR